MKKKSKSSNPVVESLVAQIIEKVLSSVPAEVLTPAQKEFWFYRLNDSHKFEFRLSDKNDKRAGEIGPYATFSQMKADCITNTKLIMKNARALRKA